MKPLLLLVFPILFLGLIQVGAVSAQIANSQIITIGAQGTEWNYVHSSPNASRLIIEFSGGAVAINPYNQQSIYVTLLNPTGVGGLFVAGQIDELILLSYPQYYGLTVGTPILPLQVDAWLPDAVAWAHQQNYSLIFGYGYSAGSTVWMRYALSDEFGHARLGNETVTGLIVKAYANQSCTECFLNSSNITLPILFLAGTEDTTSPLVGIQQFYNSISSPVKSLITFPTNHQGMAEILPTTEQVWLIDGATAVPEYPAQIPLILITLVMSMIVIRKYRR